jgi:hypothetical protein
MQPHTISSDGSACDSLCAPAALSAFSAADVHRVEGIMVYFGRLVLLYELVRRLDRGVILAGREWSAEAGSVEAAP